MRKSVVVAAVLVVVCIGNYVTVTSCADRLKCSSSCVSTQVTTDQCMPLDTNRSRSQFVTCIPFAVPAVVDTHFSDSQCTQPTFAGGAVCGSCFPTGMPIAPYYQVRCLVLDDGTKVVNGTLCPPGHDPRRCDCFNGEILFEAPVGQCTQVDNGHYIRIKALKPAAQVMQVIFDNANCSGRPSQFFHLEVGACINGTSLTCHGDF